MTDEDALHAAIAARPLDKTPRLVLADLLDDAGRSVEAAYHRAVTEGGYRAKEASRTAVDHTHGTLGQYGPNEHRKLRDAVYSAMATANNSVTMPQLGSITDPERGRFVHRNAAEYHTQAATESDAIGDREGAELHRVAAAHHAGVARAIADITGGLRYGMTFRRRQQPGVTGPRTHVYVIGVTVHHDESGRLQIRVGHRVSKTGTTNEPTRRWGSSLPVEQFHENYEPYTPPARRSR